MSYLTHFVHRLDFIHMVPDRSFIAGDAEYSLANKGKEYAAYWSQIPATSISIHLPKGKYQGYWLHPVTGKETPITVVSSGKVMELAVPDSMKNDAALTLRRQ